MCMTGIHASKRRKEVVCLGERRTSAISLWAVRYAVGLLFCTCFFFVLLGSLFAILPAKTTYTYWSLHTSCSHLSHLKSVRKDQSVL